MQEEGGGRGGGGGGGEGGGGMGKSHHPDRKGIWNRGSIIGFSILLRSTYRYIGIETHHNLDPESLLPPNLHPYF